MTETTYRLKEDHELRVTDLKKHSDALNCKIEILEGQMQEESKIAVNKISNLKLKNLSLAKTIEEKDLQIEAGKKREKDLKIKASSQRRIQNLMQEKIDRLNKTIVDLQIELERNSKTKKRSDSNSTHWICKWN